MAAPTILLIGTADTKSDEMLYLASVLESAGAIPAIMDVGVLGDPPFEPQYSKHDVAGAIGMSNQDIIDLGDENRAMVRQAAGAARLAGQLAGDNRIHGMLAIGGSMATDLALDVAEVLPLGFPKFIVSTVAFSSILPPERISPDVMMILWAGGLYGLNSVCRTVLSQAAGAVVGACKSVELPAQQKPLIGMTSLGKSTLKYMVRLKPEIEKRGYELAVFHTTGMGGRAMEALATKKKLAAVLDFSLIEVSNHRHGSVISAGSNRLEAAGAAGVPQIVAPGGVTLVDFRTWADVPPRFADREVHTHNRLIACAKLTSEERVESARCIAEKLMKATGPTAFIMPLQGIDEWDRKGGPFHDPAGLAAFAAEIRNRVKPPVELAEVDAHINDAAFADCALEMLDRWIADGKVTSVR
ncbi:MAG: Tm-1-like ATP-binding domain-containing protein [Gammaproteobacteria bacterium]|nr:Tm-1-like ATP-binding domain-containing protein [Gammaproteobacteria bacterium]